MQPLLDARVVRLDALWRRHFGGSVLTVARRKALV